MATLTGNLADVTNKAPENISSITVKAPAARIGGSSGSSVIVTSPATVDFNSSTGNVTISDLTNGLSWLYIEGDGWSDSIALSVADGMVTLVEAVANALGMPGIVDYIRLLADLENRIEDVAQDAVDAAAENIKWIKRDLATGEDLNTVVAAGLYTVPSYTRATSLINRPPNEAIQAATLRVTVSGGGAIKQRWERIGIAGDRLVTYERSRDSTSTWSEWGLVPDAESVKAADWFKGVIPDGANLDTYQTPGEYEIPSYNAARSLSGRPDDLIQRAMLKVRVAGGTAMQEITEWTSAGVRVWKRETAGGEWRPWREGEEEGIPNTPLQTVYMWGDSAVAGGDTNGSWAAGENLPGRIGALLDTPVENRGVSGHTANTTLIRAGVLEVWATGTIPADTSEVAIGVAGLDIDLRVRRTFAATWDGIAGTLAIDGDNFTFKRSTAGTAQTISTPKRVILNTEAPLGEGAHIFLMGGNDWLSDAGTAPEANKELHLVESYRRAVEAVPGDPLKKVLIGGLKTRRSTVVGDENYRIVRAVNQQLRKMYPGIFVDRQAWLSSRGLAAAGISPTAADTAAMAAGLVPPSAFATGDDTHIRKEVVQAEAAELWANALVRKGWARLKSGTSLPAMVDTFAEDLSASLPPAFSSTGSPEGKVAAPVGSVYTDTAATNGSIRWIKASGTGVTGWRDYADKTYVDDEVDAAKWYRGGLNSTNNLDDYRGREYQGLYRATNGVGGGAGMPGWVEVTYDDNSARTRQLFTGSSPADMVSLERKYSGGAWTEWVPVTWSGVVVNSGSVDNLTRPHAYAINSTSVAGIPVSVLGSVETLPAGSGLASLVQRFTTREATPQTWVRSRTANVWSGWMRLTTEQDVEETVTRMLDGLDISITPTPIIFNPDETAATGGSVIVQSLSLDRRVGYNALSPTLRQTFDEGENWEDIHSFSGTNIEWVRALPNGELMVETTSWVEGVAGVRRVWVSAGYDQYNPTAATWEVTLTAAAPLVKFADWSISITDEVILLAEYGPKQGVVWGSGPDPIGEGLNARYIYRSYDNGKTWDTIFDLNNFLLAGGRETADGQHLHGVAWDPYWDRIWVSFGDAVGDGSNGVIYSDDEGQSWHAAYWTHTHTSLGWQVVGIRPMKDCVLFAGDMTPSGVIRIDRAQGKHPDTFEFETGWDYSETEKHLCQQIIHFDNGRSESSFFAFSREGTTSPSFIVATKNGWDWDLLWASSDNPLPGIRTIAGPTKNGNLIASVNSSSGWRQVSGRIDAY